MSACHTKPFVAPGIVIPIGAAAAAPDPLRSEASPEESCDYCGSASLEWRKCKLICNNCRQINKSCADL